jgi:hypothetical protein
MMRKQEMSESQLRDRERIAESMQAAGWRASSNENEMFDQGLSVMREVVMEYSCPEVSLAIFYRADQNALYLSMDMPDESSIELRMDVDARLDDLLGVITAFQDKLTQTNYKEHIRSLIAVCKNIYAMNKEEKFVRLTDMKSN